MNYKKPKNNKNHIFKNDLYKNDLYTSHGMGIPNPFKTGLIPLSQQTLLGPEDLKKIREAKNAEQQTKKPEEDREITGLTPEQKLKIKEIKELFRRLSLEKSGDEKKVLEKQKDLAIQAVKGSISKKYRQTTTHNFFDPGSPFMAIVNRKDVGEVKEDKDKEILEKGNFKNTLITIPESQLVEKEFKLPITELEHVPELKDRTPPKPKVPTFQGRSVNQPVDLNVLFVGFGIGIQKPQEASRDLSDLKRFLLRNPDWKVTITLKTPVSNFGTYFQISDYKQSHADINIQTLMDYRLSGIKSILVKNLKFTPDMMQRVIFAPVEYGTTNHQRFTVKFYK